MHAPNYYFDYAAATPVDERVLRAMLPYFGELFYNPSSPYEPAIQVKRDYNEAKRQIATVIGAQPDELVMCAGATESINLALRSTGGQIVYSAIEHDSVRRAARAGEKWIEVPVQANGLVDPEAVRESVTDETTVVSVALANHELGTVQPIARIARIVDDIRQKRRRDGDTLPLLLHCDASQGLGHVDVHVARLGVDLMTLNAAKVYGPKQVGLLWVRPGVLLRPVMEGGGQEMGLRSGTENVAGVIGFAEAVRIAEKKRKTEVRRLADLRDALQAELLCELPFMQILGSKKHRLAHFLSISLSGFDAERILFLLETKGVYVATGSACAANKGTGSAVLAAIGLDETARQGSLRISLGRATTKEGCDYAAKAIIESVRQEAVRQGVVWAG